jgi:hypothetical protein
MTEKNGRELRIKGDHQGVFIFPPGIAYQVEMSFAEFGRLVDELSDIKAAGSLRDGFDHTYNVKW